MKRRHLLNLRFRVSMIVCAVYLMAAASGYADEKDAALKEAPVFTVKDVYDKPFTFKFPRRKPVYLAISDQGGSEQSKEWRKQMLEEFDKTIQYKSVAKLDAIPTFGRSVVQRVIRELYDYTLLDWTGEVAKLYRCKPNVANVFIIDRDGKILAHYTGAITKKRLEEVRGLVDEALKESDAE